MPLPRPSWTFWPWVIDGAFAQVAATALMLIAMGERSFVVTIAYLKTEPIQAAIFGLIFLGDAVTFPMLTAILDCHGGRYHHVDQAGRNGRWHKADAHRPCLGRHVRAVGGRLSRRHSRSLHLDSFVMAATFTLVIGLAMQAVTLSLYLWLRDPAVLKAIVQSWKPSLFAGFMGALASQFWFLAFALATAASVRTLALVEVLFAQLVARFAFKQKTTAREAAGMVLVVAASCC